MAFERLFRSKRESWISAPEPSYGPVPPPQSPDIEAEKVENAGNVMMMEKMANEMLQPRTEARRRGESAGEHKTSGGDTILCIK
ncbi:hypothetical protein GMDG_02716 [Pseudogymnoascus destructans 20631-21]|uniref:Uncharacterized protein n=1 Tax=Pseudogymnoascus destructans (strain ATCC MYA-4855 / 20631-21) TaxID=658429 RepID=L8G4G3_PSED2|nr:hypothetical protein GMDG_02716 [Pseudogymnoascus destructans 20631-21]